MEYKIKYRDDKKEKHFSHNVQLKIEWSYPILTYLEMETFESTKQKAHSNLIENLKAVKEDIENILTDLEKELINDKN